MTSPRKPLKTEALAVSDPRQMFKAMAMDIGKELAAYIEVMYPDAVKAASSTFLLSVRNHTYNEIMGWADRKVNPETLESVLTDRATFRRNWKATYRKIRSQR